MDYTTIREEADEGIAEVLDELFRSLPRQADDENLADYGEGAAKHVDECFATAMRHQICLAILEVRRAFALDGERPGRHVRDLDQTALRVGVAWVFGKPDIRDGSRKGATRAQVIAEINLIIANALEGHTVNVTKEIYPS